jgi:hypothetical protein
MRKLIAAAVLACVIVAAPASNQELLARDCAGTAAQSSYLLTNAGMPGWIGLHRPDGEIVRIKTDQIVFVMSALNTGADKRALSRVQLLNGFTDVRESVDDVMLAIKGDDAPMMQ